MSHSFSLRRAEKRISRAKQKSRPELIVAGDYDEWSSLNFAKKLNLCLESVAQRDLLQRINVSDVSNQEFIDRFESRLLPVVITNITNSWPAKDKWTIEGFLKKFRNERFKCGEDDYGYNVKLKMKYFVHYMRNNLDDSPLYIFDGNFGEHKRRSQLLHDYTLPEYFKEDLFKFVGANRRPPYRWIVVGSARSGTGIHIDPLGTSAWNALLVGYKWWCLFPTHTPKELLKLTYITGGKQHSEAAQWFHIIYPLTRQKDWPREFEPIEILQRPGETVFVPSGWWHVVMNLTDTIAITQNFVSTTNFPIVWHKTVRSRPKLSSKWISGLKSHRPDLVEMTKSIDTSLPIGVTSDSSSGSSSSSSSGSSCSCSSCQLSDSEDSGQASLSKKKRKRRDTTDNERDSSDRS